MADNRPDLYNNQPAERDVTAKTIDPRRGRRRPSSGTQQHAPTAGPAPQPGYQQPAVQSAEARRQQALQQQQARMAAEKQQEYAQRDQAMKSGSWRERRAAKKAERAELAELSEDYRGFKGIRTRIKDFFEMHPPAVAWGEFMEWLYAHSYIAIVLGVLFIAIGLTMSRYISFGGAIFILLLGVLVSRYDEDYDGYLFYGAALFTFVIPYLF